MSSLLDLPPELLEQIISILAEEEPLSATCIYEQPSESLLYRDFHPLKDLSSVSKGLRQLCFSSLFSALKVDLELFTGFLEFINSSQLVGRVNSLVLFTTPECLGSESIWPQTVEIVECVNASSVTMIFPPPVFAKILPYEPNLEDAWAFGMDYQVLHLEMPRSQVAPKSPATVVKDRNVFGIRPWTHCTYNEGSSVKGYSTYEYHLKDKPSLFCRPPNVNPSLNMLSKSFDSITSLDIIAVFPTSLLCTVCAIYEMKNLHTLRTQLAPTPSNSILDDPLSLGKCQTKDIWMEFEGAYVLLINFLTPPLPAGPEPFRLQIVKQFTILDYANMALRDTIDNIVGHRLDRWERDLDGGTWTRTQNGEPPIS